MKETIKQKFIKIKYVLPQLNKIKANLKKD